MTMNWSMGDLTLDGKPEPWPQVSVCGEMGSYRATYNEPLYEKIDHPDGSEEIRYLGEKEVEIYVPEFPEDQELDEFVSSLRPEQIEAMRQISYDAWNFETGDKQTRELWEALEEEKKHRIAMNSLYVDMNEVLNALSLDIKTTIDDEILRTLGVTGSLDE